MSKTQLPGSMKLYQLTAIFSIMFALVGFSYNVWRMEVSEHNSSVREAAFELLLQLAELEQVVYAAYYDQDTEKGNPRDGWVKVGLIVDLSMACGEPVTARAVALRDTWSRSWEGLPSERTLADDVVAAIEATRKQVHATLTALD